MEDSDNITVAKLIEILQLLSDEDKAKLVYASYDCTCHTGVYGVSVQENIVVLIGD